MVSYVVNDFIVFCSDRFLPNFSDDQTPLVSLLVFCLVIILVYSISYNTIYLVKFAPEYLI
jgi:hypothetical protein